MGGREGGRERGTYCDGQDYMFTFLTLQTHYPPVWPLSPLSTQEIHVLIILSSLLTSSQTWPADPGFLLRRRDWTDQGKFIEMRLLILMERRGEEQFVREISTQNWQDGPTQSDLSVLSLDNSNFLAATGTHNKLGFCCDCLATTHLTVSQIASHLF